VDETLTYDPVDYDFNIYMPRSVAKASVENRDSLVQKLGLRPFAVGPNPGRPYSFFVKAAAEDGRTQFVDYPTTLRASYDVIDLTLRSGALGERQETRKLMSEQEIRNFAKAIGFLLERPEISFPHDVKFWWITEGKAG
jgi:hypothetical protein